MLKSFHGYIFENGSSLNRITCMYNFLNISIIMYSQEYFTNVQLDHPFGQLGNSEEFFMTIWSISNISL